MHTSSGNKRATPDNKCSQIRQSSKVKRIPVSRSKHNPDQDATIFTGTKKEDRTSSLFLAHGKFASPRLTRTNRFIHEHV